MAKRQLILFCSLAILSSVSGYLMSRASWLGRVGITFLHRELNFIKIWWQGAVAVLLVLLVLYLLLFIVRNFLSPSLARIASLILALAAIAGLYFTYIDFSNDFSHKLMGWRFHYGVYLFWIQWALVCLFFVFVDRKPHAGAINSSKRDREVL